MLKKWYCLILVLITLFNVSISCFALDTDSQAAILYDIDNDCIIFEKNANEVRQVASLTKLMAIIVALEEINDLNETIVVDEKIIEGYSDYTKVGFEQGDVVTYKDLLYGMMLPSGADAALLIAYHVAGSESSFATLMNKKAKELNMVNSSFDNTIGMDSDNNYSNAYDLLKLLKYALKNEEFKTMFCTKQYTISKIDKKLETTIRSYTKRSNINTDFIIGSKTGFTDGASYCLASLVSHDNHPLILITLGGDSNVSTSAIQDSAELYSEFSENYHYTTYLIDEEHITSIPIKMGWKKKYEVKMPTSLSGFVEEPSNLYFHFAGVNEINRDIKKGDYIGKLEVYQNNRILGTCDFYLEQTIFYHYPLAYMLICLVIGFKIYKQKKKK